MGPAAQPSSAGTRGEILALLCTSNRRVSELASELGISATAVRAHLELLQREGMIGHELVRRGVVGKPALEYHLTADGERVLSRAYLPMLLQLFDALASRIRETEALALMHEVGRGLAARATAISGDLRERAEAAAAVLNDLGGMARVEERNGRLQIVGACCPIAAVAPRFPLACKAIETLVGELVGVPVREHCDRSGRPRCQLVIGRSDPPDVGL